MTVRGPVPPDSIGPTLTHEHVFWDARAHWEPLDGVPVELARSRFEARFGGLARWNGSTFRDDLCQLPDADYEMVADEVRDFRDQGGSCIVELSSVGLHPCPAALRRLSQEANVHIVEGSAFYVHAFHPEWVETASVDQLTDELLRQLSDGIDSSGVRPGVIGEVGTSAELFPCEERILRAAARAAVATGTAVNIHAEPPALPVVLRIIELLTAEGLSPARIWISHLDEIVDLDYHVTVLRQGVTTGFDSFGQDGYFTPTWKSLSDNEKAKTMVDLIAAGFEDQLVVSQDMGKKHYLKRFGGMGYDHVLARVVPRLRESFGVDQGLIDKLLIANPRRLLTRAGDGKS